MPAILSAKKRLRQNVAHRLRNRQIKSALRTQIKKLRKAINGADVNAAEAHMSVTIKNIDKSCSKGVLHKKTASRMKSQLARGLNKLKGEKQAS